MASIKNLSKTFFLNKNKSLINNINLKSFSNITKNKNINTNFKTTQNSKKKFNYVSQKNIVEVMTPEEYMMNKRKSKADRNLSEVVLPPLMPSKLF